MDLQNTVTPNHSQLCKKLISSSKETNSVYQSCKHSKSLRFNFSPLWFGFYTIIKEALKNTPGRYQNITMFTNLYISIAQLC
jgi:hypothetical protein